MPLYVHCNDKYFDPYIANISYIAGKDWAKLGVIGYMYKKYTIETISLYEYFCQYSERNFNHYTTINPHIVQEFPDWELHQTSGHIYPAD